jgi:hypothetical protein
LKILSLIKTEPQTINGTPLRALPCRKRSRKQKEKEIESMKKIMLFTVATCLTLFAVLPSQADSNPRYPQDRTWDVLDQGANGGGAGGGGGGGGE